MPTRNTWGFLFLIFLLLIGCAAMDTPAPTAVTDAVVEELPTLPEPLPQQEIAPTDMVADDVMAEEIVAPFDEDTSLEPDTSEDVQGDAVPSSPTILGQVTTLYTDHGITMTALGLQLSDPPVLLVSVYNGGSCNMSFTVEAMAVNGTPVAINRLVEIGIGQTVSTTIPLSSSGLSGNEITQITLYINLFDDDHWDVIDRFGPITLPFVQ